MSTVHNEAKENEIAKNVIMPGDPLRAKYIAEKFLDNPKLVNKIRNMYAYTGTYKGKEVTIMGHGMGMPSASLYAYELYKFYDVDNIIRIGSCGAGNDTVSVGDVILFISLSYKYKFILVFIHILAILSLRVPSLLYTL